MKRQLPGAVAAAIVIAVGVLATACDVTPPAASANGTPISTGTLNTQLHALQATAAGGCLLQLQNAQLTTLSAVGAGGTGTFTMAFADSVLNNQVGDLLAEQYATSKGITVSTSDLKTATSDFESTLDGEISAEVQQAGSAGTTSSCQDANGATIAGAQLLSGLPDQVRTAQIRNEAVDEKLLARGANLSDSAVAAYYGANQSLFTAECVSVIATDTQAHANQLIAQLNGGAAFADVAKASSLDPQTAANGGALGCNYTKARVEQALRQSSIAVGKPLTAIQDPGTGQWIIYEVTNEAVEPLSAAAPVARRELLQATANVTRVSREIVAFARHSDVSIDPRYGTWKSLVVVAPVAPPEQYLLAAASGDPAGTGSSGNLNGLHAGRTGSTGGT
ncbi:MAG TPA: peptidylprolyl isomerase [Acidimicrobiales bacterium]|nr:peptidylprolyl isomerase [Acidimicrobiales bacterium]